MCGSCGFYSLIIQDCPGLIVVYPGNKTKFHPLVCVCVCVCVCGSCGFYYLIIQDRPHISEDIQCYLKGSATYPLVVHGPYGHGKTLLMAAAAYHLREANPAIKMTIVVRFIGLTPKS